MDIRSFYRTVSMATRSRYAVLPLIIVMASSCAAPAQTYIGALDDLRGFMDRWFYLFKRSSDNRAAITDSIPVFGNTIRFRYHLKDSAAYWLFQQAGGPPSDSLVTLVKIPIVNDHFLNQPGIELSVVSCPGISDCEFITDRNGNDILNCFRSGITVDLKTMAVTKPNK